jgi:UDP-N-acetylmuramyl tripeptide synthase
VNRRVAATPARIRPVTGLTTPDPVALQAALPRFVDGASRPAPSRPRRSASPSTAWPARSIAVALFTNFTRDHLDYHGSMEAYWAAKRALFDWPGAARGGGQHRRRTGRRAGRRTGRRVGRVDRVAAPARHGCRRRGLRHDDGGLAFDVVEGGQRAGAQPLIGDYNASNLLVVMGGLRALGVPLAEPPRWCRA